MARFGIGKPNPVMMRAARKALGLEAAQTVMIGDTMETDILGGVQMGYHTVLTLSGGTQRDDLERFAYQPDMIVESLAQLLHHPLVDGDTPLAEATAATILTSANPSASYT